MYFMCTLYKCSTIAYHNILPGPTMSYLVCGAHGSYTMRMPGQNRKYQSARESTVYRLWCKRPKALNFSTTMLQHNMMQWHCTSKPWTSTAANGAQPFVDLKEIAADLSFDLEPLPSLKSVHLTSTTYHKIKLKKESTSWAPISPLPHVSWCIVLSFGRTFLPISPW